jgi:hypothetical protein
VKSLFSGGAEMTFKQATVIGACSAGVHVFLALTSVVQGLGPGLGMLFHSFVQTLYRPLGLLADIGLLTFFIVLYQKQKDASR